MFLLKPRNTVLTVEHGVGRIMPRACFAARGYETLYKVDGIIRKYDWLQASELHVKSTNKMVEAWAQLGAPTRQRSRKHQSWF